MRTDREVCSFTKAKPGSTLGPQPLNKRTPPPHVASITRTKAGPGTKSSISPLRGDDPKNPTSRGDALPLAPERGWPIEKWVSHRHPRPRPLRGDASFGWLFPPYETLGPRRPPGAIFVLGARKI